MKRLIKKESFEMLSSSKSMEATNDLIREIIELGDSEENLVSHIKLYPIPIADDSRKLRHNL